MSIAIVADIFEPPQIKEDLEKSMLVTVAALEPLGLCDYLWFAHDNHKITVERKEVHDFAHRIDDLERQLKTALDHADEVILLIEGVLEPIDNSTILYKQKKDGTLFYRDRVSNYPYSYFMGFLWQLDKLGISTFYTASMKGTASALTEFVKKSNDPEFTTFKRYLRERPDIPELDPQINTLIQLHVGEMRATALIKRFGTVWNVFHASNKELLEVEGIGQKTIDNLFARIGRDV